MKRAAPIICYVLISQVVLPFFGAGDYFVFARWNLFADSPNQFVRDLSFDGGQTFLFRDSVKQARSQGIDTVVLFHLVSRMHSLDSKEVVIQALEPFVQCAAKDIVLFELAGSLYSHIIKKDILPTLESRSLCDN